jgi:SRSO17 transposase
MGTFMNATGVQRLEEYFRRISDVLGDGERKSVEPIAARACPDPSKVDAMHQRLLHFAVDSRWSDREVRREAARYALDSMTQREPVEAWIVDDTGFLKQGKHSVASA